MAEVFVLNSGYRTRYPHVAIDTNCPTGWKMADSEWQIR